MAWSFRIVTADTFSITLHCVCVCVCLCVCVCPASQTLLSDIALLNKSKAQLQREFEAFKEMTSQVRAVYTVEMYCL